MDFPKYPEWMDKADFAWIGVDPNGNLGLFYVAPSFLPKRIADSFSLDLYSKMTSILIDDLEKVSDASFDGAVLSAYQIDAEKGLFVFEFDEVALKYVRKAFPTMPPENAGIVECFPLGSIIPIEIDLPNAREFAL